MNGYVLCEQCYEKYYSKKNLNSEGYFPPPWNVLDHPEKTKGWIEFQKALRKDPNYYLSCDILDSFRKNS
jgi:hypothetical protein